MADQLQIIPSKNALARSYKKRSFFLAPLQDLARSCTILQDLAGSCGILWDFAGILQDSCTNFLQDSCKILQDPTRSRSIVQDLARSCRGARKKDLFLPDLARAFLLGYFKVFPGAIQYIHNNKTTNTFINGF